MEKVPGESSSQEFCHSELQSNASIRLIQIHSELLRGDISCTLQHFETDTQTWPDYTALSYVWGDSTPTQTIYINGLVHRIHQSLWELLSHIRSTVGEGPERTWYWTDLLCIDQAHHSEKNEQIARMGDIFAQAACVISWLGTHRETIEALSLFVDMPNRMDTASKHQYFSSAESHQIHEACDQLCLREPYWGRVWVVQEVACARNCVVASGDISLKFEDLLQKIEVAMIRSDHFYSPSVRDLKMRRLNAFANLKISIQGRRPVRILELIQKTSFCQATRDQDKIYGLLGLASRLDSGFDPRPLKIAQHKTLADVWGDIIFMILHKESDISRVKDDLRVIGSLIDKSPPRIPSTLEMGSSDRRALAEQICQVSDTAYSNSIRTFLGIDDNSHSHYRTQLQSAWSSVAAHVVSRQLHVPCLQKSLGWATYAGLRFTSWHDGGEKSPEAPPKYLPFGWFCTTHSPDAPSEITEKHRIISVPLPPRPLAHLICCSAATDQKVRCDLSSVVLKVKPLGITCLVEWTYHDSKIGVGKEGQMDQETWHEDTLFAPQPLRWLRPMRLHPVSSAPKITFYCDCCEPSRAVFDDRLSVKEG